jgi:two-component system response regulator HydG
MRGARGAYHYVTKPFKMATVRLFLERAVSDRRVRAQNRELRAAARDRFGAHGFIGGSAAVRELAALVAIASRARGAPS